MIALSLLVFSGCGIRVQPKYENTSFYYYSDATEYNSEYGPFALEYRRIDITPENIVSAIDLYLQGPLEDSFTSPFPDGVTVVDFNLSDRTVNITLSRHFARLTGIDLTVACSCLTLTLTELLDADRVVISALDTQLDGKASISMERNNIILWDSADEEASD